MQNQVAFWKWKATDLPNYKQARIKPRCALRRNLRGATSPRPFPRNESSGGACAPSRPPPFALRGFGWLGFGCFGVKTRTDRNSPAPPRPARSPARRPRREPRRASALPGDAGAAPGARSEGRGRDPDTHKVTRSREAPGRLVAAQRRGSPALTMAGPGPGPGPGRCSWPGGRAERGAPPAAGSARPEPGRAPACSHQPPLRLSALGWQRHCLPGSAASDRCSKPASTHGGFQIMTYFPVGGGGKLGGKGRGVTCVFRITGQTEACVDSPAAFIQCW